MTAWVWYRACPACCLHLRTHGVRCIRHARPEHHLERAMKFGLVR